MTKARPLLGLGELRSLWPFAGLVRSALRLAKLKQPYRNVWAKLRETEKQCGFKLVKTGHTGSTLTEDGEKLLSNYMRLFRTCSRSAKSKFHQLFGNQDSLSNKPQINEDQ